MGFRFRKYIKLGRGVKLNLSKSGISLSVGKRGATVNISDRGVYGTIGTPGTGLSWRGRLRLRPDPPSAAPVPAPIPLRAVGDLEAPPPRDLTAHGLPEQPAPESTSSAARWVFGAMALFFGLIILGVFVSAGGQVRPSVPPDTLSKGSPPPPPPTPVPFIYFGVDGTVILVSPEDLTPPAFKPQVLKKADAAAMKRGVRAMLFTPPCDITEITFGEARVYAAKSVRFLDSLSDDGELLNEVKANCQIPPMRPSDATPRAPKNDIAPPYYPPVTPSGSRPGYDLRPYDSPVNGYIRRDGKYVAPYYRRSR